MTVNRGRIIIVDNDVLAYIFEEIYDIDKNLFNKVISFLVLGNAAIWIPQTVKSEFLNSPKYKRRRKRRLEKILEMYVNFKDCPITVSSNEINSISPYENDKGEADGIMQGQKALLSEKFGIFDYHFLSNDRKALTKAESMNLVPYPYQNLKERFREVGIILPL
jgi:hypothetical protein